MQKVLRGYSDGRDKQSVFYRLFGQIGSLGLLIMARVPTESETTRIAPFIITCVTATCFGPIQIFLADSHRKRISLPLNRLNPPHWKISDLPVMNDSAATRLLLDVVGGHARAIELIADQLAKYKLRPNIKRLVNDILTALQDRYSEAVTVLQGHISPIVQCIMSRRRIRLHDKIPGTDLLWEHVTSSGLIWFESWSGYHGPGYLVAPYIWIWMLSTLSSAEGVDRPLRQFLSDWEFCDYSELLHLRTGKGLPVNTTWQSFEFFCQSFRVLRSLGFKERQKVPLEFLHSGCILKDDSKTIIVNRHLRCQPRYSHLKFMRHRVMDDSEVS